MTKAKKMNTYLKYGLLMLGCCMLGAVIGFFTAFSEDQMGSVQALMVQFGEIVRKHLFVEFMILFVAEIIIGEIYLGRMKKQCAALETAEDEEADRLDYEMEKDSAWSVGLLNGIAFIAMVILATGYSMDYIQSFDEVSAFSSFLGACILFILLYVYLGFWSVRQVKLQQKLDPSKKGDPASSKFTEQWVASCDEAEREVIYRSAFKSYLALSKWIPILMTATMVMHLIWNTGILAIVVVGVVWMVHNVAYLKSCVNLRKQKLS